MDLVRILENLVPNNTIQTFYYQDQFEDQWSLTVVVDSFRTNKVSQFCLCCLRNYQIKLPLNQITTQAQQSYHHPLCLWLIVEYIDTQKGNTVPFLLQYNDKKLCVPIKSVSPNSTILLYQQKAHKKRAQPMIDNSATMYIHTHHTYCNYITRSNNQLQQPATAAVTFFIEDTPTQMMSRIFLRNIFISPFSRFRN